MEMTTNTTGLINTLLSIIKNVPLMREPVISRDMNHLSHQVLHLFNNQALLVDSTKDFSFLWQFLQDTHCQNLWCFQSDT